MKKTAKRPWLFVKVIVLDLAVFSMIFIINLQPAKPVVHSVFLPVSSVNHIKRGLPVKLEIDSLKINLPVGMGTFDQASKEWTIDDNRAYYANGSALVNNNGGSTLIYGHARWPVFSNLPDIKLGAKAIVKTDNGFEFIYKHDSMRQVVPEETGVLNEKGKPRLVLQTCSGAWDKYRSLYYFDLESVKKL